MIDKAPAWEWINDYRRRRAPRRMRAFLLIAALSGAALALTACGEGKSESPPQNRKGSNPRERLEAPPRQPPVPVSAREAITGSISTYYTATATLEAEKQAQILARVSGLVESIECEEGDLVGEGQVLLTIENEEYQLLLEQATANASSLRDRYERMKNMWEKKLVSAEEFQNIKHELEAAEAAEELARLNLSYTSVRAPYKGRVIERLVDVGQNVSSGTALFVIADFDPLLARVHVPSKEFKKLKPNQAVEIVLDSNKKRLQGRIKLVSPVIDPATGTIKITIEVPHYPPGTRPGDFAEVRIVTERRDSTTLVPRISVLTDRGEKIVYVANGETAERRVVEVGFEDDEFSEIKSGVQPGELVVVRGQGSLKHGSRIKIVDDRTVGGAQAGS